jgi:hypothetical protein
MRNRLHALNLLLIAAVLSLPSLFAVGCSDSRYMDSVHDHPFCFDRAEIPRFRAEGCFDALGRHSFDDCLSSRNVPPEKIDMLNDCIEAHKSSW